MVFPSGKSLYSIFLLLKISIFEYNTRILTLSNNCHTLLLPPFGVVLKGRNWSTEEYRYGFQNQEQDEELWEGAVTFKYRVEDARLGRFFSVDPKSREYPFYTPYSFSGNKLIQAIELEGLEEFIKTDYINAAGQLYRTVVYMVTAYGVGPNSGNSGQVGNDVITVHTSTVTEQNDGTFIEAYTGTNIGAPADIGTPQNPFLTPTDPSQANADAAMMRQMNVDNTGATVGLPARDVIQQTTIGAGGAVVVINVQAATVEKRPSHTRNDGGYMFVLYNAAGNFIGYRATNNPRMNSPTITVGGAVVRVPPSMYQEAAPVTTNFVGIAVPVNDIPSPIKNAVPRDARNRVDNTGVIPLGQPVGSNFGEAGM